MREQLGCMLPLNVRPTTPLVAAQIGLSPGAGGCGPVSAQPQRGPGADMNSSVSLSAKGQCLGASARACACAVVCVRHRARLCMRARQPTACMIWRMQTRAYVDVGAGVGVSVGEGVGVDVGAGVGVSVGEGVGLHAHTPCSMLPLHGAPHHSASRSADRPQSRRRCAPVSAQPQRGPGADVNSSVPFMREGP